MINTTIGAKMGGCVTTTERVLVGRWADTNVRVSKGGSIYPLVE